MKTGQSIFTSAFIPRIISNIVDKPLSCIMVVFFLKSMPKGFIQGFRHSSKITS